MSLLKSIGKVLKPVARAAAAYYTGGASEAILAAKKRSGGGIPDYGPMPGGAMMGATQVGLPALGPMMGGMARMLPQIGAGVGAAVGFGMRGARTVIRSATYYCKRYPAWCVAAGGLPAVADMVTGGQLPPHRARRGRGITSREFRSFRKVHRVLSQFCAPRMRIRSKRRSATCP